MINQQMEEMMKIISGTSNEPLAEKIANHLDVDLCDRTIKTFNDREIFVEIEENIRGEDVYIVQSTSNPANDHLMELLITIDAVRRGSARSITAVVPYFGYARQDRKTGPRTPISAKLVSNLIASAGANRVVTIDLHAGQIQGFFDIPVDNLYASPIFSRHIRGDNLMIVSPDVGGVVRARELAKRVNADMAIIDKRRPKAGVSEVMNIIGDVSGRKCVMIDDLVDTAGTLCNAATALINAGAISVDAYCTHGVLSGPALTRISESQIRKLFITDTIKYNDTNDKIEIISVSETIGEAIKRIETGGSISELFR
ncbi:MAG: ribose-phosphate pyrophosphokinase [Candidimonas sp.]